MQNHHGGVILMDGYLYGFDMGVLRCLDWKTGQEMWSNPSVGKGSLTCADGELYVRSENGPIALVDVNPKEYVEKGRFDQPDRSRVNSWAHPVIANGKLYISDQDNLLCYDIKK
jgi:outer membrane protein assembly factor BamB